MAYEVAQYSDGVLVDTDVFLSSTDVQEIVNMAMDEDMMTIDGMPDMVSITCIDNGDHLYTKELFRTPDGAWHEVAWVNVMTQTMTMNTLTINNKENN